MAPRFLLALPVVLAGMLVLQQPVITPRPVVRPRVQPVRILGVLTLVGQSGQESPAGNLRIELPETDVWLEAAVGGASVSTSVTQLDGRFRLTAPRPGMYRVCWKRADIGSGCGSRFQAKAGGVLLESVPVRTPPGLVYGKVLTGDDRPCWVHDPFFSLSVTTRVDLLDRTTRQPVHPQVAANVQGEYAIGGVKAGRYVVRADCEKARATANASVGNAPAAVNLGLGNRAPRLSAVAAFRAGAGITRAAAGEQISVEAIARDLDNDPIEYRWRTQDGASLAGGNNRQQVWTLSARPGLHSTYLMARDGKGGFTYKRFDINVGATDLVFSGMVVDEVTQAPVANARVTVNGVGAVTTNANGWFRTTIPPMASPERYVTNITHPQYSLLSRIHDKESTGNTYQLIRVQTTTHDPTLPIDITDTGSSGPCGPKEPARSLVKRPGITGAPTEQKPCRHRGARIVIPAGSLAATGPVSLSFATLNPARRALPGDYRAIDRTNQETEMLSFGALHAEFRDSGGNVVNLRPGTSAEVQIPISAEQAPVAAPTIAMWSYDEKTGLWVEEGQASLQNTASGPMYVGKTKHFSEINMDVAGNDPAQATCVRLQLGASLSGWTHLVLRAYVSYAGTSVQVKETDLNGNTYHAIYRIPYAPPAPPPNTLRLELRGTYNNQEVVLLNNIIATDAPRAKMTGNNLWPPYPYTECGDAIVLEADPVALPQYGDIDATGRPAFLSGPFGNFLPENGEQVATDYYNTIDPGDATNPTLSVWWTNHGFNGVDGSGGTSAQYLNFNDLGFGRDMNCKKTGGDLACYVTNYGLPDQNLDNADSAAGKIAAQRGATVAMEYIASLPADRRVRFYVYAPGDPAAAGKLKFADLDGLGPKSVPHLCLVCHGGQYDGTANDALHARFREFDLPSFKYPGGDSWDYAPSPLSSTLDPAQLTAFATLNQMVRDVAPNATPIKDLINAWYPGGFGAGTAPVKPTPPSGWSTEVNAYHNVYGQSCRTCHVARDDGVANSFFTFNTSANFAVTDYAVCGSPKVMPNAFVTYKNFWGDQQRVIDYRVLTGAPTCQ
jgi:hypothetical protein